MKASATSAGECSDTAPVTLNYADCEHGSLAPKSRWPAKGVVADGPSCATATALMKQDAATSAPITLKNPFWLHLAIALWGRTVKPASSILAEAPCGMDGGEGTWCMSWQLLHIA